MLDVELIRREPEKVKRGIANKNVDPKLVDDFLTLDKKWRELTKQADEARAKLNILSRERKIDEAKVVKTQIKSLEEELTKAEVSRDAALKIIPNLPLPEVPVGKNETSNVVIREVGRKPKCDFPVKDYLELGQKLDLIDTERAAKVSGSRFGYLKREAPLLEFALAQFAFDFLTNQKNITKVIKENKLSITPEAFIPVLPPVLIKPEAMSAMGYVERGGEEIYFLEKDQLYLVGTSEQSVGPMHMNETFDEKDLPRRYIAFSTCFRREAGSYGKDTKGILRVHQFDKLEMFVVSAPETSTEEHKLLLALEEKLMQVLELPYRVLQICSGDLGDPAAAKYDIEVWLPGQDGSKGQYRETHSTSNTTDYQSRRLNIKLKPSAEGGSASGGKNSKLKPQYVHLLNGTAFAIGRILIAILENYQTKKGSIKVPKVLRRYIKLKEIK
ncbi:MAG: serine--tRNA ligase [Candidatus Harrisonbacteria bacterium RIFCSPHIGHO2_01_FULL_44_13]|uniref:Serine--tRNA ligase n=1 Tax=Candidatus Harrisonbacteria bacterium RIFCSPLOWO2_01_FULL_44_18 TaxID=1798407 RepID=A0A1G1ZN50_9BACT|nr:MAG: serine--tRNA ligase [Candidatus Harrisonbacteria bacterium RIFCSPHIGHO2_01_FULL_44_13]OGY65971.1 MAG: serine--tRNA ligase [Candidatus Harrisonbacteria bacterium RIFCSPLOWO2_01_FULL_44_18]